MTNADSRGQIIHGPSGTAAAKNREPTAGVEPATSALREQRSDLLSYVGTGLPHRIAEGACVVPPRLRARWLVELQAGLPGSLALTPTPQIVGGEAGRSIRLSIRG